VIDIEAAFRVLVEGGVEFIVVGGVAARAHGSARLTNDLDVVYRRTAENVARLAAALCPHAPTPIDAFGLSVRCIKPPATDRGKRAAGRPRDLDAIAELEALLEERGESA
jgi:hypothetical protein